MISPLKQTKLLFAFFTHSFFAISASLFLTADGSNANAQEQKFAPGMKRPIAAQPTLDDSHLLVANRDTGSIALIELSRAEHLEAKQVDDVVIGKELTDLIRLPDTNLFLATDFKTNELLGIEFSQRKQPSLEVTWKISVCGNPIRVATQKYSGGSRLATLGLWSRQVQIHDLKAKGKTKPDQVRSVDLDFNPGSAIWIAENQLLVADAFGDDLVVLNSRTGTTRTIRDFDKHRTGGVAISPGSKSVLISQQRLSSLARSTRNDVHWGMMIGNTIRRIPLRELASTVSTNLANPTEPSDFSLASRSMKFPVGKTGNAKADLGALVALGPETWAVVIEGANQIAVMSASPSNRPSQTSSEFFQVGQRPKGIAASKDLTTIFVTNSLDNSVSIIDRIEGDVQTVSLGELPEPTAQQRGERLFFDAKLSHDGWMSCNSCHVEGHSNGMLNDNKTDDSFGTPKRVISLLGHADTFPLAWNGANENYEAQLQKTIKVTMQGEHNLGKSERADMIAYLRSLPEPPSVIAARGQQDALKETIAAGAVVFEQQGCADCHEKPSYTTSRLVEIGVADEAGNTKLNPPSLIGVSQRNELFHDNRVSSLRKVFEQPGHSLGENITDDQMSALITFLRSL